MYAGCGPIAVAFGFSYEDVSLYRIPSLAFACINLFAVQLWRHRPFPKRAYAIGGVAFSFISTGIMLASRTLTPSTVTLVITAIAAGLAYSSILVAWVASSSKVSLEKLLVSVFLATVILGAAYFLLALLGNFSAVFSLLYPLAASLLLLSLGKGKVSSPEGAAGTSSNVSDTFDSLTAPSKKTRVVQLLYSLSFIICGGVVRALLVQSWVPPSPFDWLWGLCPLGLLFAVLIYLLGTKATLSTTLASLGITTCVTAVCALVLPMGNVILSGLIFGASWLLLAFSFAGAVDCFRSSVFSANACIALILAVSLVLTPFMRTSSDDNMALPMLSIIFLGVALALVMMIKPDVAIVKPVVQPSVHDDFIFNQRCQALADQYHLTNREYDVLTLLAKGNSLKAIAEKLFLSENTVKAHRRRLYQKMGINSRQSLIDMLEEITHIP